MYTSWHRLNIELDLRSLFGLLVHSCAHWLRPPNSPSPSPRIWAHKRGRYWSAKLDDISLQPPASTVGLKRHLYWFLNFQESLWLTVLSTIFYAVRLKSYWRKKYFLEISSKSHLGLSINIFKWPHLPFNRFLWIRKTYSRATAKSIYFSVALVFWLKNYWT